MLPRNQIVNFWRAGWWLFLLLPAWLPAGMGPASASSTEKQGSGTEPLPVSDCAPEGSWAPQPICCSWGKRLHIQGLVGITPCFPTHGLLFLRSLVPGGTVIAWRVWNSPVPWVVISLFILFIYPVSRDMVPVLLHVSVLLALPSPSETVLHCSCLPARFPSPWSRAHGYGLWKTSSLLATWERWSLQWKREPPGQATWGCLLSTLEATWWRSRVPTQVWARMSQHIRVPHLHRRDTLLPSQGFSSFFLPPPPDSSTHQSARPCLAPILHVFLSPTRGDHNDPFLKASMCS